MEVVSLCALKASGFTWQPRAGTCAFTVICKATYRLRPDQAVLAPEQEPLVDEDEFWDDDPARSLHAASDRAPYKPRADVVLVGHAHAPAHKPSRSFVACLGVGEVNKSIDVWCDRGIRRHDGQLLEGQRITKMPLRWERSAGGPDTANPVGMRFDAHPDRYGMVPVPNLQPPGSYVAGHGDIFAPIGFGPIASRWPGRTQKLHRHAASFAIQGWETRALPDDFDYAYFNVAPSDQQVPELRCDERIVLENLHPEHARLITRLPGIRPRAILDRATGEREEIQLVADTLCIDTDRGLVTLVWRGRAGLRHLKEAGKIAITLVGDDVEGRDPEKQSLMPAPSAEDADGVAAMTLAPGLMAGAASAQVMPFAGVDAGARSSTPGSAADLGLPFGRLEGALAARRSAEPLQQETIFAMPSLSDPVPPATPPSPLLVNIPPLMIGSPPLLEVSSGQSAGSGEPVKVSIGQMAVGGMGSPGAAVAKPSLLDEEKPRSEAARPAPGARVGGRDIVELLWFSATAVPRIRKHPDWKEILADVKPRPDDEDLDDDVPPGRRPSAKDRRDVLAILARGKAIRVEDLESAMMDAVGEDGAFIPPLVLIAGELEFPFDEVETLKALVAASSPLVALDRKLKETVDAIHEAFNMPWVQGATGVVESLISQLKEALGQNRAISVQKIEAHAERALLEHRHYQKRLVMGQMRTRCLLSSGGQMKVPVYLPEGVGKELPGWPRMTARLIAEMRLKQDPGEQSRFSLRVIALARTH